MENTKKLLAQKFKRDWIMWREGQDTGGRGKRGRVKELSTQALKKMAFTANNTAVHLVSMATLTYPRWFPHDGKVVKSHVKLVLNELRRRKISFLWFLEFQKRGSPHFHILLSENIKFAAGKGNRLGVSLAGIWSRAINRWLESEGHGLLERYHEKWGFHCDKIRKADGAARYVAKYAAKVDQKEVPQWFTDVGRFWGCSRDVVPVMEGEEMIELADLPDAGKCCIEWVVNGEVVGSEIRAYKYQFGASENRAHGRIDKMRVITVRFGNY